MPEQKPPVSLVLEGMNIPHRTFTHPGPVNSLEQAAHERGQRPEQVLRSILFRLSEGEYLIALVAGPAQISWKALRAYIGQSRLTMAKEEEVLAVTGYPIGAVSPFGVMWTNPDGSRIRVLVDPGVFAEDEVSIGSGIRGTTVILKSDDLRSALGDVEVVQLVEA